MFLLYVKLWTAAECWQLLLNGSKDQSLDVNLFKDLTKKFKWAFLCTCSSFILWQTHLFLLAISEVGYILSNYKKSYWYILQCWGFIFHFLFTLARWSLNSSIYAVCCTYNVSVAITWCDLFLLIALPATGYSLFPLFYQPCTFQL